MFPRIHHALRTRRLSAMTVAATAAAAFFLMGLLIATELPWNNTATAASPTVAPRAAVSTRPDSFADLAQHLSPTVVNIKVTKVQRTTGWSGSTTPDGPFGDFMRRFFQEMPQSRRPYTQQGSGSGVVISNDGHILTNNHVIEGAKDITVTLADGHEYPADIVGRDAKTDLAILQIASDTPLTVATLGNSKALRVGDWVLAIGNPFGLSHTVTSGIVSAKGRIIGAGPYDDFIQTDASINPGNSGGPLFNMHGEVVGINTAIISQGQGIGFAIPVNTAKPLIPQLVSDGKVTRGYLGVSIQTITPDIAKALKLPEQGGALVSDVRPGSPAADAGIQRGDVITTFHDKAVANSRDLAAIVAATPVGTDVAVIIRRNGKEQTQSLTVGTLPSAQKRQASHVPQTERGVWGLALTEVTPEVARRRGLPASHGVLVVDVAPESPAAEAGVSPGDLILQVNQQPVRSMDDVNDAMTTGHDIDTLLLLVQRKHGSLFVALAK